METTFGAPPPHQYFLGVQVDPPRLSEQEMNRHMFVHPFASKRETTPEYLSPIPHPSLLPTPLTSVNGHFLPPGTVNGWGEAPGAHNTGRISTTETGTSIWGNTN